MLMTMMIIVVFAINFIIIAIKAIRPKRHEFFYKYSYKNFKQAVYNNSALFMKYFRYTCCYDKCENSASILINNSTLHMITK